MKGLNKYLAGVAQAAVASAMLAGGMVVGQPQSASAQAAYGSYIGVGPSFGLTQGGASFEGRQVSAVVAARYKFLEAPISVRGQLFLFSGTTAFVPVVSYDIPLDWQTDAYIGAGYSFSDGGVPSPVGNRNSLVIQPGIDYSIPNSNLVIFGNAIYAIDGYKSGGGALSIQGGVGLRF